MLNSNNAPEQLSLGEVNGSVSTQGRGRFGNLWRFLGPGFLVSVGYMDPGNWATDLQGGSQFGYRLLWVILVSNLMAILLQTMCVRLGMGGGMDLAQACKKVYSKPIAVILWLLAEIAMIATDVAEVIGSAVALYLLFGLNKIAGVLLTGCDVLIILGLMKFGFRKLEAFIITLVATIGICFFITLWMAKPDWLQVAGGLVPRERPTGDALAITIGIIGATVMPHNLYLHSSIVQTRKVTEEGKPIAIRNATIDTIIALGGAFFVNAAILILAAAVFNRQGIVVNQLEDAHRLLTPMLGPASAALFAVALLASGQSSTITGTLSGQIVMEGFMSWKIAPWQRRMITRGLALIPALIIVTATNGKDVDGLVLSQILLSLQLPFAVFPLVLISASKKYLGAYAVPRWMLVGGLIVGMIVSVLNIMLLAEKFGWIAVIATIAIGGAIAYGLHIRYVTRNPQPDQQA